jgi:dTDP-4-amino-4,6-dideoxygalactose transaminase
MKHIPLTRPYWGKKEEQIVVRALRSSTGVGDGPFTQKLMGLLQKITGAKYAIPTTSCTHGLELTMRALGIKPGDEVIMPSFTMSSTANAVVLMGATPIFADIDPVYFNIDPIDIERKITSKTKGIIVVHYAGMPCEMEVINKIAKRHHLFVVEDAAHAIGAYYKNKMSGTWADAGVYSFHGTKNISCGEGGAVVSNDHKLVDKMEIIRANGTNRKQFLDGVIDKYSWVDIGSSYYLSDILTSILIEQLHQIKTITIKRHQIASLYSNKLSKYAKLFQLPQVPKDTKPNWHIYALKFYDLEKRKIFMTRMRKAGIEVSSHYVPLHSSEMGRRIYKQTLIADGAVLGDENLAASSIPARNEALRSIVNNPRLEVKSHKISSPRRTGLEYPVLPVTDEVSNSIVRLPIYPGLTKGDLSYIITSAQKVLDKLI